jgi:hypothetical protein
VIDGGEAPLASEPATPAPERRLILSSSVVALEKGSRAKRYFAGLGAGQSKVKVRFAVKDARTTTEVLSFEEQGSFKGVLSAFGGSEEEAFVKVASDVVENLIEELK